MTSRTCSGQREKLYGFVSGMIEELETDSFEHAQAKAFLRHAMPEPVCSDMRAWALVQDGLPGSLRWSGEGFGPAESAAYMALVLYAVAGSQEEGVSFAAAAGRIGKAARKRLTDLEMAETLDEVWDRIKCLVRVMAVAKHAAMDFADMAVQLYMWQMPEKRLSVVLDWDRQYFREHNKKRREENNE